MRIFVLILSLVLSIAGVFGTFALVGYGYMALPSVEEDLATNTEINRITHEYLGTSPKNVHALLIDNASEGKILPDLAARFSTRYARKLSQKMWDFKPELFIKSYEKFAQWYAKLGPDKYGYLVALGFWGIGFITIVLIAFLHFINNDEPVGYMITEMGDIIATDGGGCLGSIIGFLVIVAIALCIAPIVPIIAFFISLASLFFY